MSLTASDEAELTALEEALWRSRTRWDLAFQEKTFAADFFEFGRSGRRYERAEMIRSHGGEIPIKFPLQSLRLHSINEATVLITYISELQDKGNSERTNRASLWSRGPAGWQLRFHQGTPTE